MAVVYADAGREGPKVQPALRTSAKPSLRVGLPVSRPPTAPTASALRKQSARLPINAAKKESATDADARKHYRADRGFSHTHTRQGKKIAALLRGRRPSNVLTLGNL